MYYSEIEAPKLSDIIDQHPGYDQYSHVSHRAAEIYPELDINIISIAILKAERNTW